MELKPAETETQRKEVITLLQQSNLPASDIDDSKLLFLLMNGTKAIGTIGLEVFDNCALLRSVSVIKEDHGRGHGKMMVAAIEKYARKSKIDHIYLLTTTAANFFQKQGYRIITREETPASIQQTAEYCFICPSTAVVMKKDI